MTFFFAHAPEPEFRDPEEAVRLGERAVELHVGAPTYGAAHTLTLEWEMLGQAYYRAGRFEDCIEALEKSLAVWKEDAQDHLAPEAIRATTEDTETSRWSRNPHTEQYRYKHRIDHRSGGFEFSVELIVALEGREGAFPPGTEIGLTFQPAED